MGVSRTKNLLIPLILMAAIVSIALPACTAAEDANLGPPRTSGWDPIEMPEPHSPPPLTSNEENDDPSLPMIVLVAIMLACGAAGALITWTYYDYKSKAGSTAQAKAPASGQASSYCMKCGSPLPEDAGFCWSCGSETKKL